MFLKIIALLISIVFVVIGKETPIIGILSQETYIVSHLFPNEHHDSYISAAYVKYIESAGGRVIPIWIGQSEIYYRNVVNYTNGILFPGGGTYFNSSGGYGDAAKYIYKYALEANNRGIYYPLWGSCLGMEALPFAALGKDIRVDCLLKNKAIPLNISKGYRNSKLFSKAPKTIIESLITLNVTFNFHRYCLTMEALKENQILPEWRILSTNNDINGLQFISAMESVVYPFYGTQFHPEKNPFEFSNQFVPHSLEAIQVAQYFANFFVYECRRNDNAFPNKELEQESLIYNYNPVYTGIRSNSAYEQIYVFNQTDFEANKLL